MDARRNWQDLPDAEGRFGQYGGRYVAETLMPLVLDLERAYREAQADPAFAATMAGGAPTDDKTSPGMLPRVPTFDSLRISPELAALRVAGDAGRKATEATRGAFSVDVRPDQSSAERRSIQPPAPGGARAVPVPSGGALEWDWEFDLSSPRCPIGGLVTAAFSEDA